MPTGPMRVLATVFAFAALLAVVALLREGYSVSLVEGGSMRPALEPADVLFVERRAQAVSPGDIVVFPREGWPQGVAHRVASVSPGGWVTTRGDANPVPDRDAVRTARLLGRVVRYLPTGRFVRRVATAVRRWYTHEPIEQQAMTEMRSTPRAALPGTGPRD